MKSPISYPIRVLELRSTYRGGGGPDKTILNSLLYHNNDKVDIRAIYIRGMDDKEYNIDKQAENLGLKNYSDVKEKGKFQYKVFRYLKKYIIDNKVDIVHSHEFKTNFYNLLLKLTIRDKNKKFIMTAHNWAGQDFGARIYKFLDLKIIKRLDHVIAVADFVKIILLKAGIKEQKITRVYNSINIQDWKDSDDIQDLKAELGIEHGCPIIGAVGRLMPEKDIPTMFKAFHLVSQKMPGSKLILMGEGKESSYLQNYKDLACELGIEKSIYFVGYTRHLLKVYKAFDIYLMTSITEGMPNVLLEAMAMSKPVISTNVGGISEIVIDGFNGYLLNAGDSESIAMRIIELAENKSKLVEFGRNGRYTVENKFEFLNRLKIIEKLYHDLLQDVS